MASPPLSPHVNGHVAALSRRSSLPSTANSFILPLCILIGIVLAATAQTEAASYVSTRQGYDQPYFSFYLTHSTFSLIFPLHLTFLSYYSGTSTKAYLQSIKHTIAGQLGFNTGTDVTWQMIYPLWTKKVLLLTSLISIPALSWFVAMALSTPMDVTAIYAASSFAAYGFSMLLLHIPLSKVTLASVAVAFTGVLVISLDGVGGDKEAGRRMLGDGIMMFGAITLGLYEVIYKLALPEEHPVGNNHHHSQSPSYTPIPHSSSSPPLSPSSSGFHHRQHHHPHPNLHLHRTTSIPISIEEELELDEAEPSLPRLDRTTSSTALLLTHKSRSMDVIDLPPALHANFLTSCIGLMTVLLLWPPIILLHWTGYEPFRFPYGWKLWTGLEVVAWGGSLYNAGLMALIGIWGPTISSVANLLTIGVVAIIDALWTGLLPDLQTVLGVVMICIGFGVLLWEGEG